MPQGRYYFPLVQDQTQGSWMNITAYEPGTFTPALTVSLFMGGATSSQNWIFPTEQEYAETKVTKALVDTVSPVSFGGINALGAALARATINPKVEVLYRDSKLRTFQFSFIMAPKSSEEQTMIRNIIGNLRAYSSPTASVPSNPDAGYTGPGALSYLFDEGFTFATPYEFVIDFWYFDGSGNYQENTNIPRIGRGVIESVEVMYNPNGEWSTFHDGNPTSTMLVLRFREMRLIDSSNILQGY